MSKTIDCLVGRGQIMADIGCFVRRVAQAIGHAHKTGLLKIAK